MRIPTALLFIFLALQVPLTWSQNRIPIQILVEEVSEQPCGLTKDAISGRARLTLRQYGFTETKDSNPLFYISINSLELGQQCVGSIKVEVLGYAPQDTSGGRLGWVSKAKTRETVLAFRGHLMAYPRYEFSDRALNQTEAILKRVLSDIEY